MSSLREECREFRAALLQALEGRPVPRELTVLSWHQHLLSCGDCRTLLEREEALEELLATLPDPKLPPDLARRVSARLRSAREEHGRLDRLLDLAETTTPRGLAARVTEGVRSELALDRLLDLDQVVVPAGLVERVREEVALDRLLELEPAVEVPVGLVEGVLNAVEGERVEQLAPVLPWYRHVRTPYLWAAAAGLLLLVLSPWLRRTGPTVHLPGDGERVAVHDAADPSDSQFLDELDVLTTEALWIGESAELQPPEEEDLSTFLAGAVNEYDELLFAFLEDGADGDLESALDPGDPFNR